MLVYSVTNEKSFEDVRDWMSDIDEVGSSMLHANKVPKMIYFAPHAVQIAGHSVVKVIVGNKADNSNDVRTVSYERGRKVNTTKESLNHLQIAFCMQESHDAGSSILQMSLF